jgi:hypothetical protein
MDEIAPAPSNPKGQEPPITPRETELSSIVLQAFIVRRRIAPSGGAAKKERARLGRRTGTKRRPPSGPL